VAEKGYDRSIVCYTFWGRNKIVRQMRRGRHLKKWGIGYDKLSLWEKKVTGQAHCDRVTRRLVVKYERETAIDKNNTVK